jgi:hypothetical protein
MNEKPWWVYACQIVLLAVGMATILLIEEDFDWPLGDLPLAFGSHSIGVIVMGIGILLSMGVVVRSIVGGRRGLLEFLFDLFTG